MLYVCSVATLHVHVSVLLCLFNVGVTIGFRPVSYTVEEEDRFVIVSSSVLQGTLERSVVVNFSTMPGTASKLDSLMPYLLALAVY